LTLDSNERREMSSSDHDLLIGISGDVKHIREWTDVHDKKDDSRFAKVERDLEFHRKIVYGGIGIVVFVEFIMKFLK